MALGSTGNGFIMVRPTLTSDSANAVVTNANFVGSVTDTDYSANPGVDAVFNNSSYVNSDLGEHVQNVQGRVVGCGARIRYVDTELNRGGTITALEHPNHHDWDDFVLNGIQAFDKATTQQVDRAWHPVTWQPISSTELQYAIVPHPIRSGSNANHGYNMIIYVTGVPEAKFEYEVVQQVEFTGPPARGKTPGQVSQNYDSIVYAASEPSSEQINRFYTAGRAVGEAAIMLYNYFNPNDAGYIEYWW